MLTLALVFAVQVSAPQLGPIKVFGDWVVACDNIKQCEMTSLWPGEAQPDDRSPYDQVSVSVERAPGPTGGFTVEVQLPANAGNDSLRVTTERGLDVRAMPRKDFLRITGTDAAKVVAGMIDGADLRIGDETSVMGMASLKGSSAALRFIDAEQGRVGTVTATVAKGTKPVSAVPAPPAMPKVSYVRPTGVAASFTPAMRAALDKASECGSVYEGGEGELPKAETAALGGGRTLLMLPCGSGAYNYSTEPYILAAGARPVLAKFDVAPGMASEGPPNLVNATFDAKTGRLASYSKGRGIGDCGSAETYVWDGTMFRLIEARSMIECRGSVNWLTVWRAEPVAR
ncbi:DUF1176 domain-containing protein [Sphingomonas sp. LT1P40]|uniref:DUF1176 domain-containing protein n=1 Tax=Alteristakelama amylovorans TaxID=3096166 RepID=UPI002FC5ED7B